METSFISFILSAGQLNEFDKFNEHFILAMPFGIGIVIEFVLNSIDSIESGIRKEEEEEQK